MIEILQFLNDLEIRDVIENTIITALVFNAIFDSIAIRDLQNKLKEIKNEF